MERTRSLLLQLGRNNYEKIPEDIAKKLEKVLGEANSKVVNLKTSFNESQKTIEKLRKDLQTSGTDKENLEKLLSTSESSGTQLLQQLNTANDEISLLTERIIAEEKQNEDWRKKRDELVDENNKLKDMCGTKDTSLRKLQLKSASFEQQFESEMFENDEAKKNIAEKTHQEQLMMNNELKLKAQIDQLQDQIVKLSDKCKQQVAELTLANQNRTFGTAQLEADLKEKTLELSAANFTIRQLTESTQSSTIQRDGESVQLKIQLNESAALIEHYQRELDAKIKLVDLHKAYLDECQAQKATETANLTQALKETSEKCEMLQSNIKNLSDKHQLELTEINATIEQLKGELNAADDLLKTAETERAEKVFEKMFPRAAISNRMLKDNVTLTEIFSRYNDSLDEVHRLEMECLHLSTKLESLTMKLQDTTSELERQQIEYRKILKQNAEMTEQVDTVVAEQGNLRETLKENSIRLAQAESENVQLKCTQKDLARQICNLLNKVETSGNEPTSDQLQFKRLGLSNETIRKELITFDNIVELQENNQKLMLKIRELSSKVEKLEGQNIKLQSCEQKISYLERQVSEGEEARLANEDLLAMTTRQKDRFKQLYFDAMNYMGKKTSAEEEEALVVDNVPLSSSQSTTPNSTADRKDKKLVDVELRLQEKVKELKALKEEHNEYRKQSTINFDMLKQQCESVERKVNELISENSRLRSQENFTIEQVKSHRNDIAIYKKQIQVLEQRNQMYDKTIAKQEVANNQMRQHYWSTIMQLSAAENRSGYLDMECRRLTEANKNLDIENGALHRQKMTMSIVESSCELAKISSERCDFEGRLQMETQLQHQRRQYEVLKRKLEDEQIRFKEENESLTRQRDCAINKLSDEQAQAESLRTKLSETRGQVEAKIQHIKNLNEKLHEAITNSNSAACLSKKTRSLKELEAELNNKNSEIEKLSLELEELATKTKLFDRLKSNWEAETNRLKSDLQACKLSETNSKEHIEELQGEIRIRETRNSSVELENMRAENKKASKMIIENNKELLELRRECQQLKENLQIVETNYADVLSARSSDLQSVTSLRTELSNCQEQIQQWKSAKVQADESKKQIQMEWEATSKTLTDERQELEHKMTMLDKRTLELVDLLQSQNTKPSSDDTLNESLANSSIMNRTFSDEEFEKLSSESLFGVVKYLRREKDIAATQVEVMTIEKSRLSAELDMQKNKVNELCARLNSIESLTPSINNVALSAECEKLHGTLSAVTDSNILLRAENKGLCHRVEDLADETTRLEGELLRLQEENRKLFESKAKEIHEIKMLSENASTLKRNQRQSTEEINSINLLNAELASEKEKQRQAEEEINLMKAEKSRLEQENESKSRHLQTLADDRKQLVQKISKQEAEIKVALAKLKTSAESELKAKNEAKRFENQCRESRIDENVLHNDPNLELLTKDHVTSTENVTPATASLKKHPNGSKRSRDTDAVHPFDTKVSSAVEKVSPQSKRARLQRRRENDAPNSNVDEDIDAENREIALDDEVALLPGAQQITVDGNGVEMGDNEFTICDDTNSEIESIDSGRVSTDLTAEPEEFQLGRLRRASSRTECPTRRGRSRLNK